MPWWPGHRGAAGKRVAILVPSLQRGDATGNDALGMHAALASRGWDVRLFAEGGDRTLGFGTSAEARPFLRDGAAALFHQGTQWDNGVRLFERAPGVRIARDHNVTPARFFDGVSEDFQKVRVRLPSAGLFSSGRADLTPAYQPLIGCLGRALADEPGRILVVGHTDSVPIRSARFPSNWELSTARAIAVAQVLIAQGIPPDRVAARGFAEFQPLDPGESPDAYRRNRRIEIKLTTKPSSSDARGINSFRETYPSLNVAPGLIICAVERPYSLNGRDIALPWDTR